MGDLWQWQRAEKNATQALANAAEMHAKDVAIRDARYAGDISVVQEAVAANNFSLALSVLRNQIPQAGEPIDV